MECPIFTKKCLYPRRIKMICSGNRLPSVKQESRTKTECSSTWSHTSTCNYVVSSVTLTQRWRNVALPRTVTSWHTGKRLCKKLHLSRNLICSSSEISLNCIHLTIWFKNLVVLDSSGSGSHFHLLTLEFHTSASTVPISANMSHIQLVLNRCVCIPWPLWFWMSFGDYQLYILTIPTKE